MAQVKKTTAKAAKEETVEEVKNEEIIDEELAPTDEIFPDGPTQEWVDNMKLKVNGDLYMTRIGQEIFIWRPIKRQEYRNIMKTEGADNLYKEEKVCERCVLWPQDKEFFHTQGAGFATVLSTYIYEESGFTDDVVSVKL